MSQVDADLIVIIVMLGLIFGTLLRMSGRR